LQMPFSPPPAARRVLSTFYCKPLLLAVLDAYHLITIDQTDTID